jgi:antitoxin MazE
MKSKIIRIGNSRGIRIPKPLIEQLGIERDVEIYVEDDRLVISRVAETRAGWGGSFRDMAAHGDDILLDGERAAGTAWDGEEWEW